MHHLFRSGYLVTKNGDISGDPNPDQHLVSNGDLFSDPNHDQHLVSNGDLSGNHYQLISSMNRGCY